MFRARLASVLLAAGLAASGGCISIGPPDHPWFGRPRASSCCPTEGCCESGCCPGGCSSPLCDGPILTPPEQLPAPGAVLPPGQAPRLVPAPQSAPMPYTP